MQIPLRRHLHRYDQLPPAPHLGGAVLNVPILPCSCHKLIYTEVLLSLSAYGFQGGKWLTSESFFFL